MAVFQKITLGWREKDYVVPPERMLGLIAEIEEIISLPEIFGMIHGKHNMSKISRAYGAALRYAGAPTTDEEAYEGMFGAGDTRLRVLTTLGLMAGIMMPPKALAEAKAIGAASEGKVERAKKARSRLSKGSTKPSSAAAT